MPRSADDEKLVADYLEATDDLSQLEASGLAAGITQSDVSRWRRGEWEWLTAKKRRAIRQALKRIEEEGADRHAERRALHMAADLLEETAGQLRERADQSKVRPLRMEKRSSSKAETS